MAFVLFCCFSVKEIFVFIRNPSLQSVTLVFSAIEEVLLTNASLFYKHVRKLIESLLLRLWHPVRISVYALDEVTMYFPIGSFRSFLLPIEDSYEIIFIRSTRDRLKLVVLTSTTISIWLTKVINLYSCVIFNVVSLTFSRCSIVSCVFFR
jgi:hypothetical protein